MINPYAVMYDARMTVKRWQEVEKDGYTRNELEIVAQDRPCRYSSSGQASIAPQIPLSRTAINCFVGWRRMFGGRPDRGYSAYRKDGRAYPGRVPSLYLSVAV